ncbi:DUF3365 domain-containing protein [Halobacteriovorax sp. GB3]|uniref:Tll0287-like domain-containing protein n=1 Tax=Halobacteriovorax sp. GB3 TaxID=2719615 RepID=UPI002362F944|nr:DUF3365 domain-containing protein [Halobacteriovorax sp. GB3]MDD0854156.1 DUF3365 domain-containing protein [Halobacteriovorax sp. GB3]
MILLTFSLLPLSTFSSEKEVLQTIQSLGSQLKKELKSSMRKSPVNAIETCHIQAPKISSELSTKDLKIGRVSFKNRNPDNKPKDWMISYMEDFHIKKIKSPYLVVQIDSKTKGLIKPIVTAPLCLTCHGENISTPIQHKIKKLYPNDKATGYKIGQIRGFFWATYKE